MRTAARNDDNQTSIVNGLRAAGYVVWIIRWPVDLLVDTGRGWLPMEVKDGAKSPSRRKLTDDEAEFFRTATSQTALVTDVDSALRACSTANAGMSYGAGREVWLNARWISGHAIEPDWPVRGGEQRVVCADQAEAALRRLSDESALWEERARHLGWRDG